MKKTVLALMLSLSLIGMLTSAFSIQPVKADPGTWIVDDDGPADFHTIQEALNTANQGDTIYVCNGTYCENVVVNKTVSLIGEDRHNTIIDGNHTGPVINIIANYVNITGFTIQDSGPDPNCGIYVSSWNTGNNVSYNTVTNNYYGIFLFQSSNNSVVGNSITNNERGIRLSLSSNNVLRSNSMADNRYNFMVWGFCLSDFVNDVDASNTVNGKPVYYWINRQNVAVPLDAGYVALIGCKNITVQNLKLGRNEQGILLAFTTNSKIAKNSITNNRYGILLLKSSNNRISGNSITNNHDGIRGWFSNNFICHNNFVDNAGLVYIEYSVNVLDNGVEGNYWSNYNGADYNHDGIGDTSHVAGGNNRDRYPLMGIFHSFNTSLGYHVNTISNSTIEDFSYFESNSTIKLHVSNSSSTQSFGFCRVCIPKDLMSPPYTVIIDDGSTYVLHFNDAICDNDTHRWIYFAFEYPTHEVDVIPEFPSFMIMPIFILATLLAVIGCRKYSM